MVERVIDYDRGVIINQDPITGIDVFMYHDQPGVYLNAHGVAVPDAMARAAGYDIDGNAKLKLKHDRIKAAKDAIEADLKDAADDTGEVIKLDGGYSIVGVGLGRYILKDPENNTLTETPLSKQHAEAVAKLLAQKETAPVVVAGKTVTTGSVSGVKK